MELSFVIPFSLVLSILLAALLIIILALMIIEKMKFLTPRWKILFEITVSIIILGMLAVVFLAISDINNPRKAGEGNFVEAVRDLLFKIIVVVTIITTIGDAMLAFYFLSRMKHYDFWARVSFSIIEAFLAFGLFVLWNKIC